MLKAVLLVLVQLLVLTVPPCTSQSNLIVLDDTEGLGRTFDGIGGLSGGSVSTQPVLTHTHICIFCALLLSTLKNNDELNACVHVYVM